MDILLLVSLMLTVSAGCTSEFELTKNNDLVPYTSELLGIRSLVSKDWVQFFPAGIFVRAMPQSDPSLVNALAEADGKVLAVAAGSPMNERDALYEMVFLPAVDPFEVFNGAQSGDSFAGGSLNVITGQPMNGAHPHQKSRA